MIDTQRIIELIHLLEAVDADKFPLMAKKAQRRIEFCEVLLKLKRNDVPVAYVAQRMAEETYKLNFMLANEFPSYQNGKEGDKDVLLEKFKARKPYKSVEELEHKIKFAFYHMIE